MIWSLEAELDRCVPRNKVDQSSGNEERRNAPRALFMQRDRGVCNSRKPADTRADENARPAALLLRRRLPAGIGDRLLRGCQPEKDEVVDAALLLRIDPLVGVEGAIAAVAARNIASDLRREVFADFPASRRDHVSSAPQASGVTRPIPVTTTLRILE